LQFNRSWMAILEVSENLLRLQQSEKVILEHEDIISILELRTMAWVLLGRIDKASLELDYVLDLKTLFFQQEAAILQLIDISFFLVKAYCESPAWCKKPMLALDRLHYLRNWLLISVSILEMIDRGNLI
jgi:hypothetical protein